MTRSASPPTAPGLALGPRRQAVQIRLPKLQCLGKSDALLTTILEAKAVTHDGYIWPVPRHEMRSAEFIIARMAEDFDRVVKSQNRVTLSSLGWTADQLAKHRASAVTHYKRSQPASSGFASAARSFAAGAAELACLALFVGSVGVWAIILGA
ncbi:hypothetical protein ACD578_05275 [Microvirga sp. RSM25]|uniref:hypothetical protein n=1 Tax=Microvirga sp. RSM25 TaxID=3273802 RepID=UPI00384FD760